MTVSRRRLLRGGAALVGAVGLAGIAGKPAEAKINPSLVAYQATPKGEQRCDNCTLFQAPDACKSVNGAISPVGWCKLWVKAAPTG